MKIGLFFGSFNPIHNGHISIANYMLNNLTLNEVWFIVSPKNPFKNIELIDKNIRLQWVEKALKKHKNLNSCSIEFNLPEPSFTINTLKELKKSYSTYKFLIIMGSDNYKSIDKWKNSENILQEHTLYIYPRNTKKIHSKHVNAVVTNAPLINISSATICQKLLKRKTIKHLVPNEISSELCQHFLNHTFK